MKLNLNLLNKFVDLSKLKIDDIVSRLTDTGFEIEAVIPFIDTDKLTICEIINVTVDEKHPHVNICQVSIGTKQLSIITTASNVYKGMKALVAIDGTELRAIKKKIVTSKLYNHTSEGMMIGLQELGIPDNFLTQAEIDSIFELDKKAPVGEDGIAYLNWNLPVLDVSILPNRIDVYNYYNFAKEFAALFNVKLHKEPFHKSISSGVIKNDLHISNESKNCQLFSLSVIDNIEVKMSPLWMRVILWKNDINQINNLVDCGNLLMMILNQPVHVYDYDTLNSKKFIIKEVSNEKVELLNNISYQLENDLCIVNNDVVALAGLMGTLASSTTNATKKIALEVANFNFKTIRDAQKKHGLVTSSSIRYARGVDSSDFEFSHQLFLNLLAFSQKNLLKSNIVFKQGKQNHVKEHKIVVSFAYIKKYSSIANLTINEVEKILTIFGFKFINNNLELIITVPKSRRDVLSKQDIVEEIVRYLGYGRVQAILPKIVVNNQKPFNSFYKYLKAFRAYLVGHGFFETINYSLTSAAKTKAFNLLATPKKYWKLANEISSNRNVMRASLIPGLLETIVYNNNKQIKNVNIFEQAKIFYDDCEKNILAIASDGYIHTSDLYPAPNYNFYSLKGLVEGLLKMSRLNVKLLEYCEMKENTDMHFGKSAIIYYENMLIGYLGEIHPLKQDEYKIKHPTYVCELDLDLIYNFYQNEPIFAKEISSFPKVSRDISITSSRDLKIGDVVKYLYSLKIANLINIDVFDVFERDESLDEISIALRFEFQALDRTLNDEEIVNSFNKIQDVLIAKFTVKIRD